eukprot:12440477-Alexandrium_andersonii.AAC.1
MLGIDESRRPATLTARRRRCCAKRGASCVWTCGMGASYFRRLGAPERAVWPVRRAGSADPLGWTLGLELTLTRGL